MDATAAELTDWVGRWSSAYDHTRDARLGSLRGKARTNGGATDA